MPLRRSFATPAILLLVLAAGSLAAQSSTPKKAMTVEDYTKWRSINSSSISSDGQWVTYVLSQTNTNPVDAKPVMHLLKLDTNQDVDIANATAPAFSADARWVAYQVDPSNGGRGGRGRRGGGGAPNNAPGATAPGAATPGASGRGTPQPPRRVELRNLATGAVQSWQDMQSFSFASTSNYILLRRRAPQAAAGGRGGAPAAPAEAAAPGGGAPRGSDVILHDLLTGHDQLLGSVSEASFNKSGDLLAYTVEATPRDGNGLFVIDLKSGRVNPIDNDARIYSR